MEEAIYEHDKHIPLVGKGESNPLTDMLRRVKHGVYSLRRNQIICISVAKCDELTSCQCMLLVLVIYLI